MHDDALLKTPGFYITRAVVLEHAAVNHEEGLQLFQRAEMSSFRQEGIAVKLKIKVVTVAQKLFLVEVSK